MKFLSLAEVLAGCPGLNLQATMRVDEYLRLVADCTLPKDQYVECQLIDEKGHACRQLFGNGWVARRKDEVEVLIGGQCALRHFVGAGGESLKAFKAHSAELVRQNKLRDARTRLLALQTDEELAQLLSVSRSRIDGHRARVFKERSFLPHAVLERLARMGGESRGVPGEEKHSRRVERDGRIVEVPDWRPFSFGTVSNPQAVFVQGIVPIEQNLHAAEQARFAGTDSASNDLRTMTARLNALTTTATLSTDLTAAEESLVGFATSANLRVICWLAIDEGDRRKVAMRALELAGEPCKTHDAKNALIVWSREIRARNGDREFRPVHR